MDGAKSGTRPHRLGAFVDGVGWVEHEYGRVWQKQDSRLIAAPDTGQIELAVRLAETLDEPFRVVYVLLVPRDDEHDEGRFELMQLLSREGLGEFLHRYRQLFEGDGRHHLWITAAGQNVTIQYDQHNVLYLQGPLERFEAILNAAGLREGHVHFPSPHSHHYHDELDTLLDDMLERYEWQWYPMDTRGE